MRKTGRKLLYAVAEDLLRSLSELSDDDLILLRKTARRISQKNWWCQAHAVAPVVESMAGDILFTRRYNKRSTKKAAR